jgi:ABC-2 type transport system permease protein
MEGRPVSNASVSSRSEPASARNIGSGTVARGVFNRAVWKNAVGEAWVLLVALAVFGFAFAWLYVWLISKIELPALFQLLAGSLKDFERLSGVPFREVATEEGRLALAFIDPIVNFAVIIWAISRGSDAVSGELDRGTMEMLLAQPVSRLGVYMSKAVVVVAGLLIICTAVWCGMAVGIRLLVRAEHVSAAMYIPPTMNMFGLGFALAGVTAAVSSFDRYRWRTIGIMGGFYLISLVLKLVGRMAPDWEAVGYASVFWTFEPQRLVGADGETWQTLAEYNAPLLLVGLAAYVVGAIAFSRRDLPAPL